MLEGLFGAGRRRVPSLLHLHENVPCMIEGRAQSIRYDRESKMERFFLSFATAYLSIWIWVHTYITYPPPPMAPCYPSDRSPSSPLFSQGDVGLHTWSLRSTWSTFGNYGIYVCRIPHVDCVFVNVSRVNLLLFVSSIEQPPPLFPRLSSSTPRPLPLYILPLPHPNRYR